LHLQQSPRRDDHPAAICTIFDLLARAQLPQQGFVRQEDIPLQTFLKNRFGEVYAKPPQVLPQAKFGGAEQ
jgi:hypothetical protein